MITAAELVVQEPEDVAWLVAERLVMGGLNLLVGDAATGKTFLALDLALGMCARPAIGEGEVRGHAWGGLAVMTGNVLYYCLDSSPGLISQRVRGMCAREGLAVPQNLVFDFEPFELGSPQSFERLLVRIRSKFFRLVVFDVLARYLGGLNENSMSCVSPMLTMMRQVCNQTGAGVLFIHHNNKHQSRMERTGERVRGSSDIFGSMDCALNVSQSGNTLYLHPMKNRLGLNPKVLHFQIASKGDAVWLDFDPGAAQAAAMPTLVSLKTGELVDILKSLAGNFYTREAIEEQMEIRVGLASRRSMDRVFAGLGQVVGLRVVMKDSRKYYGWFG